MPPFPPLPRDWMFDANTREEGREILRRWREENQCPQNDRLCGEAVWFTQTMLLGEPREMDFIAETIAGIQKRAADLVRKA